MDPAVGRVERFVDLVVDEEEFGSEECPSTESGDGGDSDEYWLFDSHDNVSSEPPFPFQTFSKKFVLNLKTGFEGCFKPRPFSDMLGG